MQIRLFQIKRWNIRRISLQVVFARRSMSRKTMPAKYVLAYPWGALRLRAAATLSLPACLPSPLPAGNHLLFPSAPAARPQPCALTLCAMRLSRDFGASYSGAPLLVRRFPRFSLRRATSFPSRRGSRFLRSRSHRHASNASPPYVLISVGRVSRVFLASTLARRQ